MSRINMHCRLRPLIFLFQAPTRRIAVAIALSLLVHALLLWLPQWRLPHGKPELPPLTARLEPLPEPEKQDAPERDAGQPLTRLQQEKDAASANEAVKNMRKMEKAAAALPLKFPRHLQLAFAVYKGASGTPSGELLHQLDIRKDRYTLKSVEQEAGVAGQRHVSSSYGKVGEQGLRPEIFEDEQTALQGREAGKASFRWREREVRFSQGGRAALPDDAQDVLSFMYQLSQLPMRREIIPLALGDAGRLEDSPVEIGGEEEIDTPMGKLRALHLRKIHERNQPYFEIWLGVEYRLLPVKFRRVNEAGETVEEYAISDMRASVE